MVKSCSGLPVQKWMKNIRGYYDKGENCREFRLLTWTTFIGQFIQPVGWEGKGSKMVD